MHGGGGVQSLFGQCPNVGSYKLNGGSLNSSYTIGAKNSVVLESHSLFHSSCIQLSNLVHSVVLFSPNMPRTWGVGTGDPGPQIETHVDTVPVPNAALNLFSFGFQQIRCIQKGQKDVVKLA